MGKEQADPFGLMIAAAAQESDPQATVILFGSRARGDHRPDSDVDLLVVWDETLPRAGAPQQSGVRCRAPRVFSAVGRYRSR